MNTVCHKQLSFESLFSKQVTADFAGGNITSDAGGLLLRELDERHNLTEGAANCLDDPRHSSWVIHELKTLVKQRIFSIALGYEDNNDAETLRRLAHWLFELYVKAHPGPRDVIVIDIDATDDPTHGQQQLSFFHGYYEAHMYHPLFVFDGISGFPLACMLRPGNTHAAHRSRAVLKRLIKGLKKAYPKAEIVLRADAGFAVPRLYSLCEEERIHYVIGLITNDRLKEKSAELVAKAKEQFEQSGEKQRLFTSFNYRADSWSRSRRVVAKAEYMEKGANQRFVVSNIFLNPQRLYDEIYVLRGDTENRIKELKLEIKADRLSCHRFLTNQFRLFLHTFAYCLFWHLRDNLRGTELANAQVGTLRLKLLKVGARIRETSRRVWIHMASGYPYQALFSLALERIKAAPT